MIILRDKAYLEQREYGVRDYLAKKFDRSAKYHKLKSNRILRDELNDPGLQNQELRNKLKKRAEKEGAGVFEDIRVRKEHARGRSQVELRDKELEGLRNGGEPKTENDRRLTEAVNKSKHGLIISPNGAGEEELAHEIGHVKNKTSKNPVTNFISKKARKAEYTNPKPSGFLSGSGIRGKITRAEENNATKKGLKILKEEGATEDEIKVAKRSMERAKKVYEHNTKAVRDTARANFIRPKH